MKFEFNDINISFIIDQSEFSNIVDYTYNKISEYNLPNIKIKSDKQHLTIYNKDDENKINITLKELNMDKNKEFLHERNENNTPFG
jgi:hypothetical protein